MNSTKSPPSSGGLNSDLSVVVSFSFDKKWEIGPAGRLAGFPAGSGLGGENVEIGPVHLAGLSAAEIAAVVAKRVFDMEIVAKAIAVASAQFADALSEATLKSKSKSA